MRACKGWPGGNRARIAPENYYMDTDAVLAAYDKVAHL